MLKISKVFIKRPSLHTGLNLQTNNNFYFLTSRPQFNKNFFIRKTRKGYYLNLILARIQHMTYPCVPVWMKERERDKFDYPLRSAKEIAFEQYMKPPLFTADIYVNNYTAISNMQTLHVHKADNRNNEIKIVMRIEEMHLTPLQKKRLIFLLGPRYLGDGKIKIVMRKYTNLQDNLNKAIEIFQQLYWEAKRAPLFIWNKMTDNQKAREVRKFIGKKAPMPSNIEEIKEQLLKSYNEQKTHFDHIYESGQFNAKFVLNNIQNKLDKVFKTKDSAINEEEENIKRGNLERQAEERIARDKIEQNLVKKQVLTKKAYETFFKLPEEDGKNI
jgi:hypothetical protein